MRATSELTFLPVNWAVQLHRRDVPEFAAVLSGVGERSVFAMRGVSGFVRGMRVIAIDPSLRGTGFAVLEKTGGKARALEWGRIGNAQSLTPSECLVTIRARIADVIERHKPECAAIEGVIFVQSYKTAITLGAARGAALLAAAEAGLPIYEYAPRKVKQSVVGRGGAQKDQVGFMVRVLLGLTETPDADAADALAIGLTHFQAWETAKLGAGTLVRI